MNTVRCQKCSRGLRVNDSLMRKKVRCPGCRDLVTTLVTSAESPTRPPVTPSASEQATMPPASDSQATLPPSPQSAGTSDARAPAGYAIEKELGRGGMGVVYLARSVALQRPCALKMILAGVHSGDGEVQRFQTEAQDIARLQHPGIVQVFEIGEHDGKPFMALEFCGGGSLDAVLAKNPLPPRDAAMLVKKIAAAVQTAHEAEVLHRDLKPANILLTKKGEPKVTDFGLAKKLDEQGATSTGSVMGTPSYMPPEQANGDKAIGPSADVYALGAILYECLTGRPPFRAATPLDTLLQVISDEPVPPRQLNAGVPVDLETICLKCLQKDPTRRYASAQQLGDDLKHWLKGEPIRGRPVGTVERAVKWVRSNVAVSLLAAAVLLVLSAGAIVSSLLAYAANQAADDAARQAEAAQRAERLAQTQAVTEATARQQAQAEKIRADRQTEAARLAEKQAQQQADAEAAARRSAQEETKRAEAEKARAEQQLLRAEQMGYAAKLALVQSATAEGDGALMLRHLNECQWNLRGWEHRHLSSPSNWNGP